MSASSYTSPSVSGKPPQPDEVPDELPRSGAAADRRRDSGVHVKAAW
jgi:hypothetical protein